MADDTNDIPIEAWNTVLFEKFVRFKHLLTLGLVQHGRAAILRAAYPSGSRVLDIGCGFGDSTLEIAQSLLPSGAAVGVDCAQNFIAWAERDAAEAKAPNATFFAADVQTGNLNGPYDHAYARFGTMFFNMPGAAFRNIARSLKPGGTLTMTVWRKREDNPWVHDAERLVREMVPVVAHEDTDQVHCGPGPFSLSGADTVSDLLQSAGFREVTLERHDCDICIGLTLDEAIEFAMALGPAGEIIRLAGAEGERLRPKVSEALRALLTSRLRGNEVWAPSSAWIVRATRPG